MRSIERIVDAVDDFLEEHLHGWNGEASSDSAFGGVRGELRRATAGLLFLRNKLEAEQTERRVRMARACHALLRAAREDDDATALPLLSYRDLLRRRLREAEQELAGVRAQAADATDALARLARAEHRLEARRARGRAPRRASGR
jgi:hypothetical protein